VRARGHEGGCGVVCGKFLPAGIRPAKTRRHSLHLHIALMTIPPASREKRAFAALGMVESPAFSIAPRSSIALEDYRLQTTVSSSSYIEVY